MAHAEDAEDAENDFAHAEARSARRFIHIAVLAARERNKITESICTCRTLAPIHGSLTQVGVFTSRRNAISWKFPF